MKEKIAATKKASPMDSGNEASSEDSNDSNSSERKVFASGSKDESALATTGAGISSLINMMRPKDGVCTWTGSDQSMFRALQKVFLNNYCIIASSMLSKSCQEVSCAQTHKQPACR